MSLLAECAEGLRLLLDEPLLLKPPLTDAFRGRLWAEGVGPGRSQAAERGLLESAAALGVKPVASPACYFAEPSGRRAEALRRHEAARDIGPAEPVARRFGPEPGRQVQSLGAR